MTDDMPTRRSRRGGTPPDPAPGAAPGPTGERVDGRPPRGGILGHIRKNPTTWLVSGLIVAFVGLGTGAVFTGVAVASRDTPAPVDSSGSPQPQRPVPESVATPSELRTCSIRSITADPRLEKLYGAVVTTDEDPQLLWQVRSSTPERVGSVLKTFTAAAAIAELGPEYRITTSVLDGAEEGTIVIIGRGDATLSALPPGTESVYEGAPKLSDLAAQVVARYAQLHPEVPIERVILDAGYWNPDDNWHSSWARSEQTQGYHSEVTALQVDGDRADPTRQNSPRSDDPVGRAGAAFVQALRDADPGGVVGDEVVTATGAASGSRELLGEVVSQPVSTLIRQMMLPSDNTIAEMLARVISKHSGLDGSSASVDQAISSALETYRIDTAELTFVDGSGLSHLNTVPARAVAEFMVLVQRGERGLGAVRDALSVSGQSGGLASRFTGDNAEAQGSVHAKTGWLTSAYSLAGYLDAADGTRLAFSFSAVRDGIAADAREALDTLATAVYRCGGNLSPV